jgi:hypothetical protein
MQHEIVKPPRQGQRRAGQGKYFCLRCGTEGTLKALRATECKPGDTG